MNNQKYIFKYSINIQMHPKKWIASFLFIKYLAMWTEMRQTSLDFNFDNYDL